MTLAWSLVAVQLSAILTAAITPAVRRYAIRASVLDHPDPRKIHSAPTPLLGGVGVWLGCFVALGIVLALSGWQTDRAMGLQLVGFFVASTFLLAIGSLDDSALVHSQIKLFAAMPVAGLVALASGVRFYVFTRLLGEYELGGVQLADVADLALTLFWIIGVTAAFNLLDGMDGLCAGVAASASLFFLVFAATNGQFEISILAAAVLGACAGFLVWNFNPASIFLGDGGAIFLGFMLAVLGVMVHIGDSRPTSAWFAPVFILGLPIFDTTLVTVSRIRRGVIPFSTPGKDHIMHRIARLGLPQRTVVLSLYGVGLLLGLAAVGVSYLAPIPAATVFVAALLLGVIAIVALEHVDRGHLREQRKEADASRTS